MKDLYFRVSFNSEINPRPRNAWHIHLMIHDAQSAADLNWDWPHFSKAEMSCRHCGEVYLWPEFMDRLEALRERVGQPLHILSAHRCSLHNARIGGAPRSQHLKLAADISLHDHHQRALYCAAKASGFTGFGFYHTFLHIDLGRARHWYGNQKARDLWQTFLD